MKKYTLQGILIVLILLGYSPAHSQNELQIGFAKVNITPPNGMRLCGTFEEKLSEGVHDSLYVRAFVFSQGKTKFALAGCDLAMVSPEVGTAVRERIESLGIAKGNTLIHASETHNGPDYFGEFRDVFHKRAMDTFGHDPAEPINYTDFLVERIAKAIKMANDSLKTSQLYYAEARASGLSFYRRFRMNDGSIGWNPGKLNPNIVETLGPTDSSVPVLSIHQENEQIPDAMITGFAMHLATLNDQLYSADYPFYLDQKLKSEISPRLFTHFLQPPCNEVNHLDVNNPDTQMGYAYAKVIGESLADSIVKTIKQNKVVVPDLRAISDTIALELQSFPQNEVEKQHDIWYNADRSKLPFLEVVHSAKVSGIYGRHQGKPVKALIQVFQISPELTLVGLPSEVSIELGLDLKKKSPYKNTVIVQLSNDWIGYIPPRRIFEEGNYEAVVAKIKPGEGERLIERSLELLIALKKEN